MSQLYKVSLKQQITDLVDMKSTFEDFTEKMKPEVPRFMLLLTIDEQGGLHYGYAGHTSGLEIRGLNYSFEDIADQIIEELFGDEKAE